MSEHHTLNKRCSKKFFIVKVGRFFAFLGGVLLCIEVLVNYFLFPLDIAKHEF
jgi:hypothetical protein